MPFSTIELSRRTGVAPGTLRVWGQRYGFPRRRDTRRDAWFDEEDAEQIRSVLRLRDEGYSIRNAIERVASRSQRPRSVYAELRRRAPGLQPARMSKPHLLAISHAIEDEAAATGDLQVLIGSFQTASLFRQSSRRWHELTRTTVFAAALADFPQTDIDSQIVEIRVDRDHPLNREWVVIAQGLRGSACVAGWEVPAAHARDPRSFEVVWSFSSDVVQTAITAASAVIDAASHGAMVIPKVQPGTADLEFGTALTNRMMSYLTGGRPSIPSS